LARSAQFPIELAFSKLKASKVGETTHKSRVGYT